MNTAYEIDSDATRMVYVKAVDVADLPEEVRDQADGLEQLYTVHSEDGQQLALVANRKLAFHLARQINHVRMAKLHRAVCHHLCRREKLRPRRLASLAHSIPTHQART